MEHQMTVRFSSQLSNKLKNKAKNLGLERSDIIRMALTIYLEESEEVPYPYEKVKHLVGSIRSGVPDLGSNHREHLRRKFRKGA